MDLNNLLECFSTNYRDDDFVLGRATLVILISSSQKSVTFPSGKKRFSKGVVSDGFLSFMWF